MDEHKHSYLTATKGVAGTNGQELEGCKVSTPDVGGSSSRPRLDA